MVAAYIQERTPHLDPARLVSMGYGQHRPVDTNQTWEGRAHNRRVEMIITGLDLYNEMGDALSQYQSIRNGEASLRTEPTISEDGYLELTTGGEAQPSGEAP